MKICCQISPVQTPIVSARGFFASLQRLSKTARFVSVDLTDIIFASMPRRDGAPYEAVGRPNPDA